MTSLDIGSRLKVLREQLGISQRRLAREAGVTNGLISQIEQNRTSPSVATLYRILNVMEVSMAEFFSIEMSEPAAPKYFYRAAEMTNLMPSARHYPNSEDAGPTVQGIRMRGVGRAPQNALMMMHEVYAAGADTGEAYSHEGEEAGIILSGSLEVTVGDAVATLGEGDGYIFDSAIAHRFRNTGIEDCIIISASTLGPRESKILNQRTARRERDKAVAEVI